MRKETIIIPALDPSEKLLKLIDGLLYYDFTHIIVVNDGSSAETHTIFDKTVSKGCTLLCHPKNLGKGEAIKTAIRKHRELYGDLFGVITVDADGQHIPEDVVKISEEMSEHPEELVLGTRDFQCLDVPRKSRYGNKITSLFFKFSTGINCNDTQTGLRGIPYNLLELAENETGSRYDYEMHFLEDAVKQTGLRYVPITTIYENNNSCSHFRAFRDSVRIYSRPLKYLAFSLTGASIDLLIFYLIIHFYGSEIAGLAAAATVIARIFSGSVNFLLNKYWCFKSKSKFFNEAAGYGTLFIIQMLTSAFLVESLSNVIMPLAAKIIVDSILFIISYNVQKNIIFRKDVTRMSNRKKRPVWAIAFSVMLVGYTTYTLLDAFVIPHNTVKLSETQSSYSDTGSKNTEAGGSSSASDSSLTGGFKIQEDVKADNKKGGKAGSFPKSKKDRKPSRKKDVNNFEASEKEDDTGEAHTRNADSSEDSPSDGSSETVSDNMSYSSDNVTIKITEKTVNNTSVYIADIQLKDSSLLKSAVAENTLGRNIMAKTSEIASDANAILAINGDFYGFRDSGYVMRNGYLYRNESSDEDSEDLVVYSDGKMEIIKEGDITAEELEQKGAVQIYSFGPGLVKDGEIAISENTEVDQSMHSNPRTAIGYYSDTHYCFVVSDGRTDKSEGLSLYQLAEVMKYLGVTSAYNLDGGGSSTMYFNGKVINNPTTNGNKISERKVSDIICITE